MIRSQVVRVVRLQWIMLALAYVILVGVIVWLSYFIPDQFDQAKENACALEGATLRSMTLLSALETGEVDIDIVIPPEIYEALDLIRDQYESVCGPLPEVFPDS